MGIDLWEFFLFGDPRRRTWREFYDFIELLPPWGHYKTAVVMDQELARRFLDAEEDAPVLLEPERAPTPLYYDPLTARLDLLADRLMAVRTAVQAGYINEHKEPQFDPITRPETAVDHEREHRVGRELRALDELIQGTGMTVEILGAE